MSISTSELITARTVYGKQQINKTSIAIISELSKAKFNIENSNVC